MSVAPKLRYAVASTALGGIFFALVADMSKFPGGWIGYAAFLVGVFFLALYLHGKVD
jgi:hypothetical protein